MIDLKLPEYKIKEIKYQLKEGKTAIIKFFGGTLDDIDIIEESEQPIEEPDYHPFSSIEDYKKPVGEMDAKELGKSIINYLKEEIPPQGEHPYSRKKKELHDYKPVSCLEREKGMQETLEASKKKEWIEDVRKHPSKPTPTGNALFPIDNTEIGKAMSENTAESLGTEKFYTISKEAAEAIGFKKVGTMKIDKTTDKIIEFIPNSNKDEDKQEE